MRVMARALRLAGKGARYKERGPRDEALVLLARSRACSCQRAVRSLTHEKKRPGSHFLVYILFVFSTSWLKAGCR